MGENLLLHVINCQIARFGGITIHTPDILWYLPGFWLIAMWLGSFSAVLISKEGGFFMNDMNVWCHQTWLADDDPIDYRCWPNEMSIFYLGFLSLPCLILFDCWVKPLFWFRRTHGMKRTHRPWRLGVVQWGSPSPEPRQAMVRMPAPTAVSVSAVILACERRADQNQINLPWFPWYLWHNIILNISTSVIWFIIHI